MTEKTGWTRRMVLATKAALTGALALPVPAFAHNSAEPGVSAMDAPMTPVAPARWETATADELRPFLGQRFRVSTRTHGALALRLVDVASPESDPARPGVLTRRLSVSAIFDGPDAQILAGLEDGIHRLSHPRIGQIDAFLKTLPRRSGGSMIELVLN
ncbi:hypothetical protein FIU86_14080 [Roseovarius sp. THAF9]|uniref:DUF6916 family protein n=1 Tax=Roseovarius sp. THAF9 TaxID=2587847 RepID=UPI0012686D01|nr:hypothetical protein [Roseovarius sp. THAF9]QFT93973.1 hypothetical protein FIU86_14080 [Roseovarius sp. THAF9]